MQCISSFNKQSPLLTFNICIYSRLWLNIITVFSSMSTRFGISTRRDSSGCVELPKRLQLEINCLNRKKTKTIKPVWIRKVYFSIEKFFVVVVVCYYLRLNVTFCLVWFVQKIQEETKGFQKRLNTSLHVVLNFSNSHRLQIEIFASHTRTWNIIAACSRQWTRKTAY